ncbi:MAG: protein kinase [Planctomycetales bacterium]
MENDDELLSANRLKTVIQPLTEGPGTVIGPYRLMESIGEGGMGIVFVAEQHAPVRRKVALKLIKPGMDTREVIARFEAERQALALMDHPHIARVLDAGATPSGRPYFVMELVKGTPITQFCDDNRLSPRKRLELFISVCQAVQHAHQKGIIHRDIKPSNILVVSHDGTPVAKVIDFGVAKATGQQLTEKTLYTAFAQVVGTPLYMSPEQAGMSGLDIDTRTDIYSLGVLLYELLTGTTPFDKERVNRAAIDEIRRMIREEEPPKPSTRISATEAAPRIAAQRATQPAKLAKLVRGELDWVVMKCLEKDRNRRYETANGLALDIQRYLADESVQACPPSAAYRFRRFARRNKAALLTAALVSAALIVGTLVSTRQAIRATRAEGLAKTRLEAETQARADAEVQRRHAEIARQAAVANLQKARDAVDRLLTHVGDQALAQVPQMEPVRKALLEDALEFYQGFLEDDSSNPAIREGTAEAWRRMGSIHELLGQHSQAEQAHREAIDLFGKLAADFPAAPAYRVGVAVSRDALVATLQHLSRFQELETASREAVRSWEELAAEFPENVEYLRRQATATLQLSGYLKWLGRSNAEAEDAYRQARSLFEKLGDDPLRIEFLDARRALREGRLSESEQHFRAALGILQEQLGKSPHDPELRQRVASTQATLALVVRSAGRQPEAEKLFRDSIALSRELVTDFPNSPQYRALLADTCNNLFPLLVAQRRFEEAEQIHRQLLPHVEKVVADVPLRLGYRQLHLSHLQRYAGMLWIAGRPEEADQVYRRAVDVAEKMLTEVPQEARFRKTASIMYYLGGLWLAASPDPKLRDPATAVEFARKAIDLDPADRRYRFLLGAAQYRAGEWQAAIAAFEKSMDLGDGGGGFEWFFLAMAWSQLDGRDEARQWYDKAVEWDGTGKHADSDYEFRRIHIEEAIDLERVGNPIGHDIDELRAEAAALLGIAVP